MQELEAKFLTASGSEPEDVIRRLQESLAWAGFRIQPQGRRAVTDTYLDTPDQSLRAAGWSFRERRDAAGRRVALKEINRARAAVFDRDEIEQTVPDGADLRRLEPGPVRDRLSNLLHPDASMAPLFTIHNRRAAYRLSHPDHPRGLVEMAFDQARVDTPQPLDFSELELELKSGPHELLASALAAAELEPELLEARLSKFERGLIAAACDLTARSALRPRQLNTDSRWLDLGVIQLKAQLAALRAYEPHAWEGVHPEGVHLMRVATRRGRAALDAFGNALPGRERERLAADLRWLTGVLGRVRDLDVHLEHLDGYRAALEPYRRASLDNYRRHLESLRREAHAELVEALDAPAYQQVLSDYRALLKTAGRPEHVSALRVCDVARTTVAPLLRRVLQRGRAIDADSKPSRLHKLRIEAKQLRYQLEALAPAYDGTLAPVQSDLKKLQDLLGEHQDADVARAHLADYRRNRAAGKTERKTFKRLAAYEKRRARRLRKRFPKRWTAFEHAAEGLIGKL